MASFDEYLSAKEKALTPAASAGEEENTIASRIGDVATIAGRTVAGIGDTLIGAADLATGGKVGGFLEEHAGYEPGRAKDIITENLASADFKEGEQHVAQAKGFGGKALSYLQRPGTALAHAVESLPYMVPAAKAAQVAKVAAGGGRLGSVAATTAASGVEGGVTAAQTFNDLRKEDLGDRYVGAGLAGLGGAAVGIAGGQLGKKMGLGDVDAMMGARGPAAGSILKGMAQEGVLEEAPQSAVEQMSQNYAQDKPLMEGVPEAVAAGLVIGSGVGGAARAAQIAVEPPLSPAEQKKKNLAASVAAGVEIKKGRQEAGNYTKEESEKIVKANKNIQKVLRKAESMKDRAKSLREKDPEKADKLITQANQDVAQARSEELPVISDVRNITDTQKRFNGGDTFAPDVDIEEGIGPSLEGQIFDDVDPQSGINIYAPENVPADGIGPVREYLQGKDGRSQESAPNALNSQQEIDEGVVEDVQLQEGQEEIGTEEAKPTPQETSVDEAAKGTGEIDSSPTEILSERENVLDARNANPFAYDLTGTEIDFLEREVENSYPVEYQSIVRQINRGRLNEFQKEGILEQLDELNGITDVLTNSGYTFKTEAAVRRAINKLPDKEKYKIVGDKEDGFHGTLKRDLRQVLRNRLEKNLRTPPKSETKKLQEQEGDTLGFMLSQVDKPISLPEKTRESGAETYLDNLIKEGRGQREGEEKNIAEMSSRIKKGYPKELQKLLPIINSGGALSDVDYYNSQLDELKSKYPKEVEHLKQRLESQKPDVKGKTNEEVQLQIKESPHKGQKEFLEKELRSRRGANRFEDGVVGFNQTFEDSSARFQEMQNEIQKNAAESVMKIRFMKMRRAAMRNNPEIDDIILTPNLNDLPQWARDQYNKSDKDNAGIDNVKGAYIRAADGKVLVFVNQNEFSNARDIEKTMLHELVGHFGMNKVLGKNGYNNLRDRIVRTNKHMVKEAYALRKRWNNINLTPTGDDYTLNIDGEKVVVSKKGMRSLVDELIAETAKDWIDPAKRAKMKKAQRNYFERILSWIRHSLKGTFPSVTNDDVAALLATSHDVVFEGMNLDGISQKVDGQETSHLFTDEELTNVESVDFFSDKRFEEKYPLTTMDLEGNSSFSKVLMIEGEEVIVAAENNTYSDGAPYSEVSFGRLKDWERNKERKERGFDPNQDAKWKSPVKAFNKIFSVIKESIIEHAQHSRVPLVIAGSTKGRFRIYKKVLDKLGVKYIEDTSDPKKPFLHIEPMDITTPLTNNEDYELIALETSAVDEASKGSGAVSINNDDFTVKQSQDERMNKWRKAIDKAFEWLASKRGTAWLQPLGHLAGADVYNKTQQIPRGEIFKFDRQAQGFSKIMNGKYKTPLGKHEKLNSNQKDEVFKYFTTKDHVLNENILPSKVVEASIKAKESIMNLQTRLVDVDIFSSGAKGAKLQQKIRESKGSYLPVVYLNSLTDATRFKGTGKKASSMDYLKKKDDLGELELELKGASRDPGIIVADALGTLGRDVPLFEMMGNMKKANDDNPELDWFQSPNHTVNIGGKRFKYGRLLEEIAHVKQILQADPVALSLRQTPEGQTANKVYLANLEEQKRIVEEKMFASVKEQIAAEKFKDMPESQEKVDAIAKEFENVSDEIAQEFLDGKYIKTSYKDRWLGPLRGSYIHKEIYHDLIDTTKELDTRNLNEVSKMMMPGGALERITQMWKTSKVGLNPASWVRNIIGTGALLDLSTPTNSVALTKMIAQEANALFGKGDAKWKKLAEQYGLFATTFSANEMYQVENRFRKNYKRDLAKEEGTDTLPVRGLWMMGDVGRNLADAASNTHGFMEGLFKTVAMRDYVQRWEKDSGKKLDDLNEAEQGALLSNATQHANDAIFDYSNVPTWLRSFRRTPLGSPFFTFMYKAFPAVIKGTMKHPQKMIKYYTAPYLISQAIMAMGGMDEDDFEEANKKLPRYMAEKGSMFTFPLKDDNGKISYVDMSYIYPWAQFVDMGLRLKNGVRDGVFTSAAADLFLRDLGVFSGPVPQMVSALTVNKDPFTQREIVEESATAIEQHKQRFAYMWNMAVPPFMSSHGLLARMQKYGFNENLSRLGTEKESFTQHLSSGFGLTAGQFDPKEGAQQNIKSFAYEAKKIRGYYRKKIMDPNTSVTGKAGHIQNMRSQLKKVQERRTRYLREGF